MIAIETAGIFTDGLEDTVTYSSDDGETTSSVDVVIDYFGDGAGGQSDHASVLVKKSDIPSPAYRHIVTINGTDWRVAPEKAGGSFILAEDETTYLLRIESSKRTSQWRT